MSALQIIIANWKAQPTSEKLGGLAIAFGLPLLMLGFAVVLP